MSTRALLPITVMFALACGGAGGPAAPLSGGAGSAPVGAVEPVPAPAPTAEEADLALMRELDRYVGDCLNAFTPRALDSEARYYQWVDPATGPTGQERNIYGLYTLNFEATRCSRSARAAANVEPSLPDLEAAADRYVIALEILHRRIEDAHDYYDAEEYEDDAMKRGKELHGPLTDAWKEFREADEALSALVGTLEVQAQVKALDRARAAGDGRRVLLIEAYLAARPLAQAAATVKIDEAGVPRTDAAALTAQVEAFEKAADAFTTYSREVSWGDGMASNGQEMLTSAKKLARRVRDAEPYDGFDRRSVGGFGGWMVEGSPDKVVDDYEDVVEAYNDLVESPLAQVPARRRSWTAPR